MFYSGIDPRDMTEVFSEHDMEKKMRQKSFFFKNSSKKSENRLQSSKQSRIIATRKPKHKK